MYMHILYNYGKHPLITWFMNQPPLSVFNLYIFFYWIIWRWKNKIGLSNFFFSLLPPTKIDLLVREPSYQRMLAYYIYQDWFLYKTRLQSKPFMFQTVVCLLDNGAEVNRLNIQKWTALHFACRYAWTFRDLSVSSCRKGMVYLVLFCSWLVIWSNTCIV